MGDEFSVVGVSDLLSIEADSVVVSLFVIWFEGMCSCSPPGCLFLGNDVCPLEDSTISLLVTASLCYFIPETVDS